jgi:hypothetical protein
MIQMKNKISSSTLSPALLVVTLLLFLRLLSFSIDNPSSLFAQLACWWNKMCSANVWHVCNLWNLKLCYSCLTYALIDCYLVVMGIYQFSMPCFKLNSYWHIPIHHVFFALMHILSLIHFMLWSCLNLAHGWLKIFSHPLLFIYGSQS